MNDRNLANMDIRVFSQYLGALALLGRLAARAPRDEQYGIDKAFRDANNVLLARGQDIRYRRDSRGGYSAFQIKTAKTR